MPGTNWTTIEQDQLISQAIERDKPRLRNFIRKHVGDNSDAEDILQDVFYELIEAYRLMKPVEHVTSWLFRVARNRVTDLFRKKTPDSLNRPASSIDDGETLSLEDLLPSADVGPEAAYARNLILNALEEAIEELPQVQREAFIAHEVTGLSFKEISAATGVNINTLQLRKHYAVLHLRHRLQSIYDEFSTE